MVARTWIGAVAFAAALVGCGQDREQPVREAAASYVESSVNGDGDAACAALTAAAKDELTQAFAGNRAAQRRLGSSPSCERVVEFVADVLRRDPRMKRSEQLVRELRDSGHVALQGSRATVTFGQTHIELVEAEERWLISHARF